MAIAILLLNCTDGENIGVDENGIRKSVVIVGKIIVSVSPGIVENCVPSEESEGGVKSDEEENDGVSGVEDVRAECVGVGTSEGVSGVEDVRAECVGVGTSEGVSGVEDVRAECVSVGTSEGVSDVEDVTAKVVGDVERGKLGVRGTVKECIGVITRDGKLVPAGSEKNSILLVTSGNNISIEELLSGNRTSVVIGTNIKLLVGITSSLVDVTKNISLVSGNRKSLVLTGEEGSSDELVRLEGAGLNEAIVGGGLNEGVENEGVGMSEDSVNS